MAIKSRSIIGFAAATMAAMVVLGCCSCTGRGTADQHDEALLLRSYEVDPDIADELATAINNTLARGDEPPAGRARSGPRGLLIVASSEANLDAVAELIDDVERTTRPAPVPPPMIAITYWAIEGRPATRTSWPDRLAGLAPALEGIAEADGPSAFTLAEKIRLPSVSGERAVVEGELYRITQRATTTDDPAVFAEIDLNRKRGSGVAIITRVRLAPERLLVLGQSGVMSSRRAAGDDQEHASEGQVYIVIRAEIGSASEP